MFSPHVTQLPSVTSIGSIFSRLLVVYFPLMLPSYLQLPLVTIGSIGYHIFKTFGSRFSPPVTQLPSVTFGYYWFTFSRLLVVCFNLLLPSYLGSIGYHIFKTLVVCFPFPPQLPSVPYVMFYSVILFPIGH